MWGTQMVIEAKRQLRDVWGLQPDRMLPGDEPCYDCVPDGLYSMTIDGKTEYVVVLKNTISFMQKRIPPNQGITSTECLKYAAGPQGLALTFYDNEDNYNLLLPLHDLEMLLDAVALGFRVRRELGKSNQQPKQDTP